MHVSFFVRERHDFLLYPEEGGGGGVLSFMAYTGRLYPKAWGRGVGNKYLYGEATSRGPPYPSRKRSRFVIDSYFMAVHFQQLKGIQSSKTGAISQ